jgi:hypothetical protein
MKRCPSCGTQYTDETLRYCLQDGTPLEEDLGPASRGGETETVISSRVRDRESPATRITREAAIAPTKRRSGRTAMIVALTALVTVIVLAVGGVGVWLLSRRSDGSETTRVNNSRPENAVVNTNSKPSPTPTASISPSPSASPTPNPNTAQITRDVTDQIESWKENTENFDADGLMLGYAERVDYFRTENASKQQVWQDKQRALEKYDSIKFDISNTRIDVDPSGETATAEFDKAWVFEGETSSRGKVRSQLKFRKFSGRWLITSEKDLKVY